MAEAQAKATSHFDADARAAAQEAPTLTVGGYLYRGRLLSIDEWFPWWERLRDLQRARIDSDDPGAGRRALIAFYRDYLRVVFPRHRYRWWAPDPVKHLLSLPFSIVEEALASFFFLQMLATFGPDAMPEGGPTLATMSGPPSPPGTASDPGAT